MKPEDFKAWHWPDHIARKKETRRLRDEHNALFNSHARLLTALDWIADKLRAEGKADTQDAFQIIQHIEATKAR